MFQSYNYEMKVVLSIRMYRFISQWVIVEKSLHIVQVAGDGKQILVWFQHSRARFLVKSQQVWSPNMA